MCKFTYLGYGNCDEPHKHYLIRREKCSAKAHLKHWCPQQDHQESPAADEKGKFWVNLPCPMCAEVSVVYDQPVLEIIDSRRPPVSAPHYDPVSGKYSQFAKHDARYARTKWDQPVPEIKESPESLVPKPLNMTRVQVERAASETSLTRVKKQELSPDYILPATTYSPFRTEKSAAKAAPSPRPTPLMTPPASRESSRSPPQSRIDDSVRVIPPGESSRHELASLRERARAAASGSQNSRPATPQSQRGASDRSRSGSESSTTSSAALPVLHALPLPSRKTSNASSNSNASSFATTISSSPPSKSGSDISRMVHQRPRRKDSSVTRSPPQQHDAAAAAVRPFERGRRPTRRDTGGSASERSNSPVVWRPTISQPTLQKDSLGIGAGSDIIVEPFKQRLVPFRPSKNGRSIARGEGLVENPPRPNTRADAGAASGTAPSSAATITTKKTTTTAALTLFPNPESDEKLAAEAFNKMFATEQKAHAYQTQAQAKAMAQAQAQTDRAMGVTQASDSSASSAASASMQQIQKEAGIESRQFNGGEDNEYSVTPAASRTAAAVARKVDKMLPNVPIPTALRRIKTGQVKTVTVVAPNGGGHGGSGPTRRPMKRSNTMDTFMSMGNNKEASSTSPPKISAPTNFVKVKAGAPLFSFAGVTGGSVGHNHKYAQEFEIITGPDGSLVAEPTLLGDAF